MRTRHLHRAREPYGIKGEVPEGEDEILRFDEAAIRREGSDVTIVGILKMAHVAERAAAELERKAYGSRPR